MVEDTAGAARPFRDAQQLWALIATAHLPRLGLTKNRIPRRKR
jgi:hypothetical protein